MAERAYRNTGSVTPRRCGSCREWYPSTQSAFRSCSARCRVQSTAREHTLRKVKAKTQMFFDREAWHSHPQVPNDGIRSPKGADVRQNTWSRTKNAQRTERWQ